MALFALILYYPVKFMCHSPPFKVNSPKHHLVFHCRFIFFIAPSHYFCQYFSLCMCLCRLPQDYKTKRQTFLYFFFATHKKAAFNKTEAAWVAYHLFRSNIPALVTYCCQSTLYLEMYFHSHSIIFN